MKHNYLILLPLATALSLQGQTTIVNEIGDLSFTFEGGASEASATASTLDIQTRRNSFVFADFSSAQNLAIGDSLSVAFDLTLDNVLVDTASRFDFGFADSTTTGSIALIGYDFSVLFNPVETASGFQFREGADNNLGRFDTSSAFGTDTQSFSFTILRTAEDTFDLTATSSVLATDRTVQNDVIPLRTNSFDRFYFAFRNDAWNEEFNGSTVVASVSNFTIESSAIPEPSSFALLAGLCGLAYVALRRRRK